jgi:hypothetical protein
MRRAKGLTTNFAKGKTELTLVERKSPLPLHIRVLIWTILEEDQGEDKLFRKLLP